MPTVRKLLLCCVALTLSGCPSLHELISSYGFTELKPPSKLFAPGTLVWISNKSPFQAGIICTADRAMYHGFVPQESLTTNKQIQRAAKKGISIKAEVQQVANGDVTLDSVESITMHFTNAKVVALQDVDVQDLAYKRRDARCIKAVEMRQRAGFTVSMISEALQADVEYQVNWSRKANLTVEAKLAQLQALSAGLGLNADSATDNTMSGKGLYFGIKDDAFLSWLWLPEQLPEVKRGSMVFDAQSVTDVASECEDASDAGTCSR